MKTVIESHLITNGTVEGTFIRAFHDNGSYTDTPINDALQSPISDVEIVRSPIHFGSGNNMRGATLSFGDIAGGNIIKNGK